MQHCEGLSPPQNCLQNFFQKDQPDYPQDTRTASFLSIFNSHVWIGTSWIRWASHRVFLSLCAQVLACSPTLWSTTSPQRPGRHLCTGPFVHSGDFSASASVVLNPAHTLEASWEPKNHPCLRAHPRGSDLSGVAWDSDLGLLINLFFKTLTF